MKCRDQRQKENGGPPRWCPPVCRKALRTGPLKDADRNDHLITWIDWQVEFWVLERLVVIHCFRFSVGANDLDLFTIGKRGEITGRLDGLHYRHLAAVNISVGVLDLAPDIKPSLFDQDCHRQRTRKISRNVKTL